MRMYSVSEGTTASSHSVFTNDFSFKVSMRVMPSGSLFQLFDHAIGFPLSIVRSSKFANFFLALGGQRHSLGKTARTASACGRHLSAHKCPFRMPSTRY